MVKCQNGWIFSFPVVNDGKYMMTDFTVVNCPTCAKTVLWDQHNRYKPFCSSRCKLIDLGEWASEERRIPVADMPDFEQWSEQQIP